MLWVVVLAVIAVLGLVMVVGFARRLWHQASDLMSEVSVVADQLGQLGTLLAQIQPPGTGRGSTGPVDPDPFGVSTDDDGDPDDDEDDDWAEEARALRLRTEGAREGVPAPAARHAFGPDRGSHDPEAGDVL